MKKALLLLLLLIVQVPGALAQCAMCRSTVESTFSNGRYINGSGLNTGILYLLVAPYLLVAILGYLWYRSSRKEQSRRLAVERRIRQGLTS
jgi:uncharacterized protein (DUF58 family)